MTRVKCDEHLGPIKSVDGYLHLLRKEIFERKPDCNAQVFFRGEKCCDWNLEPNLFRKDELETRNREIRCREAEMLERLELMEPGAFAENPASIDRLVMARQHGLPTRLLDVSRDPLVALYFATEESKGCKRCVGNGKVHAFVVRDSRTIKSANSDTVSMLAAFAMLRPCEQQQLLLLCEKKLKSCRDATFSCTDSEKFVVKRLNHFIAREKPYFDVRFKAIDFFRVVIVEPRRTFERLRAQSGAVMLSAKLERFESPEVSKEVERVKKLTPTKTICPQNPELWTPYKHFTISVRCKDTIREQLLRLNVNEYTIMTGLDAAATEVERWANARD